MLSLGLSVLHLYNPIGLSVLLLGLLWLSVLLLILGLSVLLQGLLLELALELLLELQELSGLLSGLLAYTITPLQSKFPQIPDFFNLFLDLP